MPNKFECIVVGVSAGGMDALKLLLPALPKEFSIPIIIVQHLGKDARDWVLANHFDNLLCQPVQLAEDKVKIQTNHIYFAPAGYHILVEDDKSFSLSNEEKVNHARPSIDVCFESAAYVYGSALIGVILTGANSDGAKGLRAIEDAGGVSLVQDPASAHVPCMPNAALRECESATILPLPEIAGFLTATTLHSQRSQPCL